LGGSYSLRNGRGTWHTVSCTPKTYTGVTFPAMAFDNGGRRLQYVLSGPAAPGHCRWKVAKDLQNQLPPKKKKKNFPAKDFSGPFVAL